VAAFRRRFRRGHAGGVDLRLPSEERAVLRSIAPQLRELLEDPSDPALARLFPPAHPDDPEVQAQYQAMVGDELVASRRSALAVFETTLDADHLDAEAVEAWMSTINAARLVLGTRLDVGEEPPEDLDLDDPDAPAYVLYDYLSMLLSELLRELRR